MKLILQAYGLGDIIFSITAIRSLGDKIIWPAFPEFVSQLNEAYPDIHFMDWRLFNIDYNNKSRYMIQDCEVIPLRWQDVPVQDCMRNKYKYFGLDWTTWKDNAEYFRNMEKENALFKELGIEEGEKYNLISEIFQSDFKGSKKIEIDNGYKNVSMKIIPGYSLFNWSKVFEQASTIHAVSSSNIYLFELLDLNADEIKIYLREPREKDHSNYDYILRSHNYILE